MLFVTAKLYLHFGAVAVNVFLTFLALSVFPCLYNLCIKSDFWCKGS